VSQLEILVVRRGIWSRRVLGQNNSGGTEEEEEQQLGQVDAAVLRVREKFHGRRQERMKDSHQMIL
jgi:hypothetical protein